VAVFLGARGRRLKKDGIKKRIDGLARAIRLSKALTPHSLRRTLASHLVRAGLGLALLSELLGHGSLTTTARYVDIDRVPCGPRSRPSTGRTACPPAGTECRPGRGGRPLVAKLRSGVIAVPTRARGLAGSFEAATLPL